MTELASALVGDSAAAPPAHIIEGLEEASAHMRVQDAPHTIYEELWHAAFWQRLLLDWVEGSPSPYPIHNAESFPSKANRIAEGWHALCSRFLEGAQRAAAIAGAPERLDRRVHCTAKPGSPLREESIHDLLVGIAAHNQYHLGRIVLLRQLLHRWPPPSGGDTW